MADREERYKKEFDLEERTGCFGELVIALVKKAQSDSVTRSIVDQLTRAGTSIGANYCEAEDAESKRDFRHKIALCRKESKEARHWLRMLSAAAPQLRDEARQLWREAKELNLIFGAILRKVEKR